MSSNNIYGITLKVWDDMSSPISKIRDNLGGLTRRIKNNQSETQKLKKNLASFSQFDKLTASSKKSADALDTQEQRVEELSAQIKASKKPTESMLSQLAKHKQASTDSASALNKQQQQVAELAQQIKNTKKPTEALLNRYKKAKDRLSALDDKHKKHRSTLGSYIKQIKKVGPTDALLKRYKKAKQRLQNLDGQHKQHRNTLGSHIKQMKQAGIDTKNLSSERERLGKSLGKINDKLRVQRGLLAGQKKAWKGAKAFGGKAFNLGTAAVKTGIGVGAAGIGIIANFNKTAAEFERYQTILETLEGSKEKAGESFDWIKDFTTSTPYELGQVTDAFVKLRSYGLDPISGDMLKTLGDTSAAMGKDLIQTVEAIADAVTGENERLKEFGIKASTKGNKVTYNFTNSKGEQLSKTVDKNNRKAIQSTLQSIWNEKYAGNMDKMSKTWGGMWSNLMDQITNFKQMVMSMGAFDFLKDKLEGILFEIEVLATGGQLEAWAKRISDGFISFAKTAWDVGTKIYHLANNLAETGNKVADFMGGWDNLIASIVVFKGIGLAASLAALATPFGAIVAAAAAATFAIRELSKAYESLQIHQQSTQLKKDVKSSSSYAKHRKRFKNDKGFIYEMTTSKKTKDKDFRQWIKSEGAKGAKGAKKQKSNFGGGRAKGGSVQAGMFYEVNEKGPELIKQKGRTFLMNSEDGVVVPFKNHTSVTNHANNQLKSGDINQFKNHFSSSSQNIIPFKIPSVKSERTISSMSSDVNQVKKTTNHNNVIPFRDRLQQPQHTIPKLREQQQREQQQQAKVSGSIHVKIDSDKPVTVKKVESTGMDLNLETGMVGFAL